MTKTNVLWSGNSEKNGKKTPKKIQKNYPNSKKYSWQIHLSEAKSLFFQLWCKIVFGGFVEELLTEVANEFVRHTLLAVSRVGVVAVGCEKEEEEAKKKFGGRFPQDLSNALPL